MIFQPVDFARMRRVGVAITLVPGRDTSGRPWTGASEVQRAPDSGGSPGTWATIGDDLPPIPAAGAPYVDDRPATTARWHYRYRHKWMGAVGNWSASVSALPDLIPKDVLAAAINGGTVSVYPFLRSEPYTDGKYAVVASVSDGLTADTLVKESGGKKVNLLYAKPLAADPDHFDSINDGTTYKRVLNIASGLVQTTSVAALAITDAKINDAAAGKLTAGTLVAGVLESGGSAVNLLYAKPLAADPDTADSILIGALRDVVKVTALTAGEVDLSKAGVISKLAKNITYDAPYAASAFTHSGLSAFTASLVWNLDIQDNAWHTDTASPGAWLRLDAGSAKEFIECRIWANGNSYAGIYDVESSDDAAAWTARATGFAPKAGGLNTKRWLTGGAHRYWRIQLMNTPGSGVWLSELQFVERLTSPTVRDLFSAFGDGGNERAVRTIAEGGETLLALAKESGGKAVNKLLAKPLASDPDNLDSNPDGTTRKLFALIDTQTFTGNGTWTKPTGAKFVEVDIVAGGGGGGGGQGGSLGTARHGGAGGGGGARFQTAFNAADLGATEAVTVGGAGASGAGGAGAVGANGGAGGNTDFGTKAFAFGGGGGRGGVGSSSGGGGGGAMSVGPVGSSSASVRGGRPSDISVSDGQGFGGAGAPISNDGLPAMFGGAGGGGVLDENSSGFQGGVSLWGGGAGGAGGGVSTGDGSSAGGAGGGNTTGVSGGGGTAGTIEGGAGGAGASGGTIRSGQGGGGGAGNNAGTGGVGGAGGVPGGAGGGGGGGTSTGGAGGAGGRGEVRVRTYG